MNFIEKSPKPRVLVYRNQPLPISETFVFNQSFKLDRFDAYVLGAKLPQGSAIPLPEGRVCLIKPNNSLGWVYELGFKLFGNIPSHILPWLDEVSPLLIHAHFGPDGAVAIPIAEQLQLPLIVSFHGTDATKKDSYVWRSSFMTHRLYLLRRNQLAKAAKRIVVQSEFLRKIVVEQHGMPANKVVNIRHGIDVDKFRTDDHQTEWGHILFVGRLVARKGLHYLIQALKDVRCKFPEVKLTVIGDGPKRAEYETLTYKELGTGVTFLGAQPNSIVLDYMRRAYIFCMPSVTMDSGECETQGVVFLEAMAMSVPVVSFSSGGIPEVVLHGETGFLSSERDARGVGEHLNLLLENRTLRDKQGAAGRERVEKEFNLKIQNAKLQHLYEKVIQEYKQ